MGKWLNMLKMRWNQLPLFHYLGQDQESYILILHLIHQLLIKIEVLLFFPPVNIRTINLDFFIDNVALVSRYLHILFWTHQEKIETIDCQKLGIFFIPSAISNHCPTIMPILIMQLFSFWKGFHTGKTAGSFRSDFENWRDNYDGSHCDWQVYKRFVVIFEVEVKPTLVRNLRQLFPKRGCRCFYAVF